MIHNIKFRAFVYEDESVEEISQAILNILPEAEIEAEEAEGMLEDKIIILSGVVSSLQTSKADKSYVDAQLAGKASTATATASADGLMSSADKAKLDAVYADYSSALTALGVIE